MNAGTRVRKVRLQKGLTQSELAGENYSAAYVSIIESGKRVPSERVLKSFARTLGVTYEELATGRPPDAEAGLEEEMVSARRTLSSGDADAAATAFRRVARRAAQYDLEALRARATLGEAFCHEVGGDVKQALAVYEELQEFVPEELLAVRADAVAGRARCLRLLGDVPYSIYVLESYRSHLTRNGLLDPEALSRIHMTLVASYFEAGMSAQASTSADEALKLAPFVSDQEQLADMHINVARVLMQKGQHPAAARSFAKAEELFHKLGLQTEMGRAHLARSFLRKTQERYADARSDLETALAIFEETNNTVNQARTLSELGSLERVEGNTTQAVFLLEKASRMAGKSEPASAAISHRELALCYLELRQPAKAKAQFKKAIDLLERTGDKHELAATYRAYGDSLVAARDYKTACTAFRSAAVALEAA